MMGKKYISSNSIFTTFAIMLLSICSMNIANVAIVNAKDISLGTTNDFEDAIAHGSSMVRIGSSIFGERV